MQKALRKPLPKRVISRTLLLFLCSYFVFLVLWIQVKDDYGWMVTWGTSKLTALLNNVDFEEMAKKKNMIEATFSPGGRHANLLVDIPVRTSSYTFNAPLTFAIMAALFPFISRRWRAYGEALAILFGVHCLYVFSIESNTLCMTLAQRGLGEIGKLRLYAYQFLWEFTDNMVIRFEPFLIGFYTFIRFRKPGTLERMGGKKQ